MKIDLEVLHAHNIRPENKGFNGSNEKRKTKGGEK